MVSLSSACFAIRTATSITQTDTVLLKLVCFLGNSSDSIKVFNVQNKIIKIMAGVKKRASCRTLF
jgi:hypothetical protein